MKNFKKDLDDAVKMTKALTVMLEKLQKQFAEMEKKHPKMPTKKAPEKKTKKAVAKKTVAKKTAPKKTQATATDIVLAIVNRSKKGVDSANIMKKTGFDKKKVANIVFRLRKKGKIKNVKEGVYVKAYMPGQ